MSIKPLIALALFGMLVLPACKADVKPNPSVTSVLPNRVPEGTEVTILGCNFSTTPANNQITFNGVTAATTAATATTLTTTVPAGAFKATTGPLEAKVVVTTEGRAGPTYAILLSDLAPEFTTIEPASARVGGTFLIRGRNFNPAAARNVAVFPTATGGAIAGIIGMVTSTSIEVIVPATAASGSLGVWTSPTTDQSIQYGHQFAVTVIP